MKKLSIALICIAVLVIACKKTANPSGDSQIGLSALPAWLLDESLPVPIEFGSAHDAVSETKAPAIVGNTAFDTLHYRIYGLDPGSLRVIIPGYQAKNMTANTYAATADKRMARIGRGDQYYPVQTTSSDNYSFYGYRINDNNDPAGIDTTFVRGEALSALPILSGISIGHYDILWGKAEAPEDGITLTEGDPATNHTYYGYNGRFARKARAYVAGGEDGTGNLEDYVPTTHDATYYAAARKYVPHIAFQHITSSLQLKVRSDSYKGTTAFIDTNVYVDSIYLKGVYKDATLPLTAGVLAKSSTATQDTLLINPSWSLPTTAKLPAYNAGVWDLNSISSRTYSYGHLYPLYEDGLGTDYGDPFFILPSTAQDYSELKALVSMHVTDELDENNKPRNERIAVTINEPTGGFLAGYKYSVTIIIYAPEKIEVVTSLADWEPGADVDDITIE